MNNNREIYDEKEAIGYRTEQNITKQSNTLCIGYSTLLVLQTCKIELR